MRASKKLFSYGLEQARSNLPQIAALAHAGEVAMLTKYGKPYAAIVPVQILERAGTSAKPKGIVGLQGTGKGLWGSDVADTVRKLRDEW